MLSKKSFKKRVMKIFRKIIRKNFKEKDGLEEEIDLKGDVAEYFWNEASYKKVANKQLIF